MKMTSTIQWAAVIFLAASPSFALDTPKPADQQSQKAKAANPNEPRTLEWPDLIPPEERDRPRIGSIRARPLFDDESGPAAAQEGSSGVNKSLDRKLVKLPGFIVPLAVDKKQMITEFLLVPYFGACIHVPPPPPNQIVYVKSSNPIHVNTMYDAVWVSGELRTLQASTGLATASYSLTASKIEKYEEPP